MIKLAIVEDDNHYAKRLEKYIERYQAEKDEQFQVVLFSDGEDILENYKMDYDVILMDIEMKFMDGMTAAQEIRKMDSEVVIIFLTNMPQYAMKGYEVEALDYVIKPINYFAFSQKIDKALKRMSRRYEKFLNLSYRGNVKKIRLSSIYYVEVQDHNLIYHTIDGDFVIRGSIRDVENSLEDQHFFRCNKCYLVNLEHVSAVEGRDVTIGNSRILVSRARRKILLDVLNNYINEVNQ